MMNQAQAEILNNVDEVLTNGEMMISGEVKRFCGESITGAHALFKYGLISLPDNTERLIKKYTLVVNILESCNSGYEPLINPNDEGFKIIANS